MTATKPTATKATSTKRVRRPSKKVEVPGQDEVKEPGAPLDAVIEQDAINQALANPALQGDGSDEGDITDVVVEAAQQGNVQVHHRKQPEIGDEWAGMILSPEGWLAKDTYNELYSKDK
ncbi:MAG: hypothetical protein [Caudoviricetes sp.]|nr:MAG: hypothetical protein [Caudoviricetes sp.]